ncbi:MAG: hypothetical protein ABIG95_03785 [Candidatus Woesearchaeota archaeon]
MKKALVAMMMCLLLATVVSAQDKTEASIKAKAETLIQKIDAETLEQNIAQNPAKFLLWTRDLEHIMWGKFSNGYFKGTDNLGKEAFGVYQAGIFAGFYDGKLFYGKYKAGSWTAYGLFGMRSASGRYVLFPILRAMPLE